MKTEENLRGICKISKITIFFSQSVLKQNDIYPSIELVQPRKTCPDINEKLLTWP